MVWSEIMTNLYIDFDGVIVNTIDITYEIANKQGIEKSEEGYSEFYQSLDWTGVLEQCVPIHDSWNCIQKIIDSEKFNVSILTHVNSLHEAEQKVRYIRKYFEDITIIPVPKVISKTQMIKTEGPILVDDFVENLVNHL